MDVLDGLKHQFVFIDLEGMASVMVSRSIAMADFVIVPLQASAVDVRQDAKAIRAVRDDEKVAQRSNPTRRIPYRAVMTRPPAPGAPYLPCRNSWKKRVLRQEFPDSKQTLQSGWRTRPSLWSA